MSKVTLTINGQEISVPAGTTLLDAATEAGFFVPTFCHNPADPGFGACRICVVEVKGARNLLASCVTAAANGMVVETDSPAVLEARRTILELILANHPQDCLTCDKNGDCRLQDYAFRYDVKNSSFSGEQHAYPVDDSNPYIVRDMNKCILCGKCVRTCAQVEDRAVINFAYRGFRTKVAPALDTGLGGSECASCSRCVALCPVGALNYRSLAGKGRTWELTKEEAHCTFCDAGCRFDIVKKEGAVLGVAAREPAEGRPLCLKGRLGLELRHNPHPPAPMLKKGQEFVEVPWSEALGLEDLVDKLK